MDALLSLAAKHVAQLSDSPAVGNMSLVYNGDALTGLQQGMNSFGPDNANALLAASITLSWRATDW
jgi:hypothetical protein